MWEILSLVLLVSASASSASKCNRYSPEEIYYTIVRPSAVGTVDEMKAYFDAIFPRVEVDKMLELMPQIKNDPHMVGNLSRSLEILRDYEYATLNEIEMSLDAAWFAFFDDYASTLSKGENATISEISGAFMGVLATQGIANTKLDEACQQLAVFFNNVLDYVIEGLTIFLEAENSGLEPEDNQMKLASELQKMIWKHTNTNMVGLIASRSLHRVLKNRVRDIKEPPLLKPINNVVSEIAAGLAGLSQASADLSSELSTLWKDKLAEFSKLKNIIPRSQTHLIKQYSNDEYLAEILIDIISYY